MAMVDTLATFLGEDRVTIDRLHDKIQTYLGNCLVEALVEEFDRHEVALSDEAYNRLQLEFSRSEESFDKLLKAYMTCSTKGALVRFQDS